MSKSKKGDNIKPLSYQEMRDYLSFLDKTIFDLIERRKVYLDVHSALIEQKAKMNNFVFWIINNYYQILILALCRILEAKKDNDERKTFKHFINSLRYKNNYEIIRNKVDAAKNEYLYDNGYIEYEDISESMQEILNSINFDKDITVIDTMHERLKNIRDKELAHLTDIEIKKEDRPEINELHKYIDKVVEMAKKYHSLFRQFVDYGENEKNIYLNFKLELK